MHMRTLLAALLCSSALLATAAEPVPEGLRAAKRIAFIGDSITQGGDYVTDLDCWLVLHGLHVEVIGMGLGSETATDLTAAENEGHLTRHGFGRPAISERLGRVLAATKPGLVIACYGMNDGDNLPADESGTKRFAAAVTHLRDTCLQAGAKRVVLCTPPVFDAKGREAQQKHEDNIVRYTEWLLARKADGWDIVDIHGPMRAVLDAGRAKDPNFKLAGDGVHPGREGHWIMASAILIQFLGANLDGISSAEQLFPANGAEIRKLVNQRRSVLFSAYMTRTGHQRPGVPGGPGVKPGPSIDEATAKAAEIGGQIARQLGSTK